MGVKSQYGRWNVDTNQALLTTVITPGADYEIPLDEMTSSARIMDWIFQVQEKTWASAADVGDLVEAIRDIFGRGFCGGANDNSINAKAVLSSKLGTVFP